MINHEKLLSPEQEKPKILYHASSDKNVEKFNPSSKSFRDPNEGPVVFATPDKTYASMFIVPVDDSWAQITSFDNVHTIVISDKERFEEADKGGAIYSFSSETFDTDPEKSKTGREWTSKKDVNPNDKEVYESGLEIMLKNGVQVYFVNKDTFDKIKKSDDCGCNILKTLQSENQKQGKNVIPIPDDE